jgi:hypothetical protein
MNSLHRASPGFRTIGCSPAGSSGRMHSNSVFASVRTYATTSVQWVSVILSMKALPSPALRSDAPQNPCTKRASSSVENRFIATS